MKKIFLLASLAFIAICGYSQTISYGINAGVNYTSVPLTSGNYTVTNNYLIGYHAGVLVDVKFGPFSIQPGVIFTTKGGKNALSETVDGFTGYATAKTTLNYIEIPLNFLYRLNMGEGNLFIGAGPYLGIGISGKQTVVETFEGRSETVNSNIAFGNADGDVKNPDFGINGLIGYQLNMGLTISAGYGYGLLTSSNGEGTAKNQGFTFSLGYFVK